MTFYRKLGLGFDDLREFLERAEHEINNPTAPATLNVVVVFPPMSYLIPHLPLTQPYRIDEAQLLKHGQVPIHSGKVHMHVGFLQSCMHLGGGDWQRARFQDGQNRLPGLCKLFSAGFQTVND